MTNTKQGSGSSSSKGTGTTDAARSSTAQTTANRTASPSGGNGGGTSTKPADAAKDTRQASGSGPTQGQDADHVVTDSGRNVGSWPDNGQPQKAGEPGEKSPETESDPPESEDPKNPPTLNPQKAGEPGEAKPGSATTEDLKSEGESAQGDRSANPADELSPSERKLSKLNREIAAMTKKRDELILEIDAEKSAGEGKQRMTTHEAYLQQIARQRENRSERRSLVAQVREAAGGGDIPTTDKAPVDQRGRVPGRR